MYFSSQYLVFSLRKVLKCQKGNLNASFEDGQTIQKKNDKRTNGNLQTATHKTKLRCPGRANSSGSIWQTGVFVSYNIWLQSAVMVHILVRLDFNIHVFLYFLSNTNLWNMSIVWTFFQFPCATFVIIFNMLKAGTILIEI